MKTNKQKQLRLLKCDLRLCRYCVFISSYHTQRSQNYRLWLLERMHSAYII